MKLSIIVPVYNVREFLPRCVESLLGQTVEDFEILLIDDGATDGSGALAEEYARKAPEHIRVLHVDNGGQGRARNFGIEIAKGEYLGFVDSDDWVEAEMYETLLKRAEETGADIVVCDFMARYADGREEYLPACVQKHPLSSAGSACNKIFKRERVEDLRFPVGLWYEDFYYSAMALLKSRRTEFITQPLYNYRCGQASTMHNNNAAKNLDMLRILDMLEEYMVPNGHREDFEFFVINHMVLDTISRLAEQEAADKKTIIREMQRYARRKIPKLRTCSSYRNESRRRRIIMRLNYSGLEGLARLLLRVNRVIKR